MVQDVYQKASDLYSAKDYKNASNSFYLTYKLSRLDTIFIYNAAVSSSLAKDYDTSFKILPRITRYGVYRDIKSILCYK